MPAVQLYGVAGPDSPRLARRLGVISFGLKNVPHNLAAAELAETAGIGVRTGCHCAHILVKRLLHIHALREALSNLGMRFAPRITRSLLPGLVRVSFVLENDEADVRRLVVALEKIAGRRPSLITRLLAATHNAAPVLPDTETRRRMRTAMEREASSVCGIAPARHTEDRPRPQAPSGWIPSRGMSFWGRPCCRKP